MVEMRRSQVDLNATDSLGRPLFSGSGHPLTYNDTPPTPFGALKELGENLSLLGRDVFGRVLPQETGNFVDTLLAGQPYSPSPRTAVRMPINVGDDGVVDTYNYDEDMSAPPEYNNAVPMVVNRNREVNVRPWVKDIGRSVSQTYNDILNRFTEEKLGSPTGETVLSIPLNNETTPVNPEAGLENEFRDTGSPGKYTIQSDRQIGEGSTFGSQGPIDNPPIDNPFVQNVGVHSLPPGARFGFDTTSLDTPNYQGLVTAVPEDRTLQDSLGYESGPGRFHSDLTYPDREANPEWGGLRDMAGGLLGGGNLADMATGLVMGNPASAAMKVAKDDSLPAGRRIGAGVTAGAAALANTLGGPAAGILGLLGGFFNSLGYHQDTDEVTGNLSVSQGGTLSGDTKGIFYDGSYEPAGGSFEQSGSLNNFNFFDALAATQPDMRVDYKGVNTNSAGARNLSGLEHFNIGGVQDAIDAGDATGGWGSYDDPGMTADNSGWG
jgi:hypothetical protein